MLSISTSASKMIPDTNRNTGRVMFIFLCLLSLSSVSCKKFLATYSQNNSFVETATDLEEVLLGDGYFSENTWYENQLALMDDDTEIGIPGNTNVSLKWVGFHYWLPNPRTASDGVVATTDNI